MYVDIAGWHLFMRDMNAVPGFKMSQALATQLGPEVGCFCRLCVKQQGFQVEVKQQGSTGTARAAASCSGGTQCLKQGRVLLCCAVLRLCCVLQAARSGRSGMRESDVAGQLTHL